MLPDHARPLRSVADRRAAHRRRPHGALQLAARARRDGGSSCCASRTPTASARRRRTSSRSSRRCAGSSSTGTRGRSSSRARAERHAEVVEQLLDGGHAYRSTRGAPTRSGPTRSAHGADRGFRGEDEGAGAVRLRVPDEGATVVRDVIRGETAFENALLDDLVIARADGTPLYNLAVVGRRPRRGHHARRARRGPLLQHAQAGADPARRWAPSRRSTRTCRCCTAPDGKKLSKRHGAASVQELRDAGYLPEAVRNYLALLGWGYDDDDDVLHDRGAAAALLARARLEVPGRLRRAEAALDERPLPARAAASTS